jgi:flagellar biosynthesis/type III secretory pathway M-ring protein FliF/YscJ
MRRLLTWLVVSLGIAALIRRLRRSSRQAESAPAAEEAAAPAAEDDPADELRRKLAESRAEDEPASVASPPVTVEERRAEIHGQGRSALEEMRETDEG